MLMESCVRHISGEISISSINLFRQESTCLWESSESEDIMKLNILVLFIEFIRNYLIVIAHSTGPNMVTSSSSWNGDHSYVL